MAAMTSCENALLIKQLLAAVKASKSPKRTDRNFFEQARLK